MVSNPSSAGHAIVRALEAHGVDRVFEVPGESFLDVLDGLHDAGIETIVCRQEGGASYAAEADGKLTGRPGVAMVTRGPGAANAMIAIHQAWQDARRCVSWAGAARSRQRRRSRTSTSAAGSAPHKRVLVLDEPARAGEIVPRPSSPRAADVPVRSWSGLPEDVLRGPCPVDPVLPLPVSDGRSARPSAELGRLLAAARRRS